MTTKQSDQDVVAEMVEEFKKKYKSVERYLRIGQEDLLCDWLTTTLTQLVKEVEAGVTHSTLQQIMDDVSMLHQQKELDDNGFCTVRDLLHSKALQDNK